MPRPRAAIDPLFEFDAPQTYLDLSAPLSPFPPGEHDPWFDQIHLEHSKPSAELAREVADAVRKLQDKERQLKDAKLKTKSRRDNGWSADKENQRPSSGTDRNKQLKQQQGKKYTSLKEMRAAHEPFQVKTEIQTETSAPERRRKPLVDVGNRLNSGRKRALPTGEKKEMKDLKELLQRHNKKFKATHTYEPPQHSVREVKQWEREMNKSYYALSAEERVQANQEIAVWKQRRQVDRSD